MQKVLAACLCQMHSSLQLGQRICFKQSDSKSIKTWGGQGCIICLVLQWMVLMWRLWLCWWMFHDQISGEWVTDRVVSGWKENCLGFPSCLPWAICCKTLTSTAVSYRTVLHFKKVPSLTRLFLLLEVCFIQSNSALQPQNHPAVSCIEMLIATPASGDCWPLKDVVGSFRLLWEASKGGNPQMTWSLQGCFQCRCWESWVKV